MYDTKRYVAKATYANSFLYCDVHRKHPCVGFELPPKQVITSEVHEQYMNYLFKCRLFLCHEDLTYGGFHIAFMLDMKHLGIFGWMC
jgi:hypothetical protein